MLNAMEFWTSRNDSDWGKCDIYFAYIGDKVFVLIEHLDMLLLNRVVQQVPLYNIPSVNIKPKRGCKPKSVTLNEEQMKGEKEKKMVEEKRMQLNRNPK